jgi:hypothetical protein
MQKPSTDTRRAEAKNIKNLVSIIPAPSAQNQAPTSQQTIIKQKLNNGVNHTTQASPACNNKLQPLPFCNRIGLSVRGRITWKCSQCAHPWVRFTSTDALTIWHCEKCKTPRFAQWRKPDQKLIAELLSHPELKGWQKFFTREMQRKERLSTCQREKLQGIAKRLGIRLEENCLLSSIEGVGQ